MVKGRDWPLWVWAFSLLQDNKVLLSVYVYERLIQNPSGPILQILSTKYLSLFNFQFNTAACCANFRIIQWGLVNSNRKLEHVHSRTILLSSSFNWIPSRFRFEEELETRRSLGWPTYIYIYFFLHHPKDNYMNIPSISDGVSTDNKSDSFERL